MGERMGGAYRSWLLLQNSEVEDPYVRKRDVSSPTVAGMAIQNQSPPTPDAAVGTSDRITNHPKAFSSTKPKPLQSKEMTAMWKPGTAKPQQQPQTEHGLNTDTINNSNKQPTAAKKLSTATMGMRFMQRKSLDSTNNNKSPKNEKGSGEAARPTASAVSSTTNESTNDRKRDISTITSSSSTNDNKIILQQATITDIHGPHSDIIGRRSFNGFHKAIGLTWEQSYTKRSNSSNREAKKEQISDDELLRRYERYVKMEKKKSGVLDDEKKRKRRV